MLIDRVREAEKALKEAMDKIKDSDVMDVFRPVFEKHPELESFSWSQYTPYFNDGEECTFHVRDIDEINGFNDDSDEWGSQVINGWGKNAVLGPLHDAYDLACKTLSSISDDLLQKILGDHVRVTVTRDGIQTEEYDHD